MLVTDDEVKGLKPWLVKRLAAISEADSQILSDYVLALLQEDSPESELHINATENLADFLGDNTKTFVDELFQAIRTKAYLPGYNPPKIPRLAGNTTDDNKTAHIRRSTQDSRYRNHSVGRKRSYNEVNRYYVDHDAPVKKQYVREARQTKRFGNGPASDGLLGHPGMNDMASHDGSPRFPVSRKLRPGLHYQSEYSSQGVVQPNHTISGKQASIVPSSGIVTFDPGAAVQAIMTLQAMGFPLPLPDPMRASAGSRDLTKSRKRCRNYDTLGYCHRGDTCIFKHDDTNSASQHRQGIVPSGPSTLASSGIIHDVTENAMPNGNARKKGISERATFSEAKIPGKAGSFPGIVVENIPEEYFDHEQIEAFFLQFGSIKNIVMRAYHHLAIVEYHQMASARAAIESPKVIFDNRFVKVLWYIPTLNDKRTAGMKESIQVSNTSEGSKFDKAQFEKTNEAAQKKHEARQALLEETENQRSEIAAKREELEKRREEEMKKLKEAFSAKGKELPPDLQAPIGGINKDEEPEALLAQLKALEDEAMSLGINAEPWFNGNHGASYRSRGARIGWRGNSARGRGRGGYYRGGPIGNGAYNLDNRPKAVKVDGVDFDDLKEERLKQYLLSSGEFVSMVSEVGQNAQIITFKDRPSAETFYYGTRDIPGVGILQFSWVASQTSSALRDDMNDEMKGVGYQSSLEDNSTGVGEEVDADGRRLSAADHQRDDEANDAGEEYEWIS